jgi:hypothetical protein
MDFEIWWLLAFAVVMTVLVGIYKLTLAFMHRNTARAIPAELERRLSRIEHAAESTAIEVERIGESQRFLTRALAEHLPLEDGAKAGLPERVVTPH